MIELKHCLLSQQAIINEPTGQLSLINIINTVTVPSLPQTVGPVSIVLSWQRDREEKAQACTFKARVFLERPDKTHSSKYVKEVELSMPENVYNLNTILNASLKLTQPDENKIIIELQKDDKWERVGSLSLEVIVVPEINEG